MQVFTIALLCACLAAVGPAAAQATSESDSTAPPETTGPIHQLRVYEMVDRHKPAFDARFHDHALRIMRRHGFEVIATWDTSNDGKAEFAYLLRWADRAAMQRGWKAFLADEEWIRIKQESRRALNGPIMGEILQDKVLVPTAWSPRGSLWAKENASRTAGER
jgi:heme-degrading monooxygenase HmoA